MQRESKTTAQEVITQQTLNRNLITCIEERNFEEALNLIQRGADVNVGDIAGDTILHIAVDELLADDPEVDIEYIKKLLNLGARLTPNERDENVLHLVAYSAGKYSQELQNLLIDHANTEELNYIDQAGKTPLLEAIEKSNEQMAVSLIKNRNVDPNIKKRHQSFGKDHRSFASDPLSLAIALNLLEPTQELLNRSDVLLKTDYFWLEKEIEILGDSSPLHVAAATGNLEVFKIILKQLGSDALFKTNSSGHTALHVAVFEGRENIVSFLLDKSKLDEMLVEQTLTESRYCQFVNCLDNTGLSPLGRMVWARGSTHVSQLAKHFVACRYVNFNLIEGGIGQSLLHMLVEDNELAAVEAIASRGDVDFTLADIHGNTPLRIAVESEHEKAHLMIELLATLHARGLDIDCNELGEDISVKEVKARISQAVFEEDFFGEGVNVQDLTVDDLFQVYVTEKPISKKFKRTEKRFILEITSPDSGEEDALISEQIHYIASELFNDFTALPIPNGFDREGELYKALSESEWYEWDSESPLSFTFQGREISIKILKEYEEEVTYQEDIDYDQLINILGKTFDHRKNPDLRDMFNPAHFPLIFNVVRKHDIPKLKAFLKFPNINLSVPSRKMKTVESYANKNEKKIISDYKKGEFKESKEAQAEREYREEQFENWLRESRKIKEEKEVKKEIVSEPLYSADREEDIIETKEPKAYKNTPPSPIPEKKENVFENLKFYDKSELFQLLKKEKKRDSQLWRLTIDFCKALSSANKEGRSFTGQNYANRRLDSLARLLEGGGICTAVADTGSQLIISSNGGSGQDDQKAKEQTARNLKQLTDRAMQYFKRVINNEFSSNKEKRDMALDLLVLSCQSKLQQSNKLKPDEVGLLKKLIEQCYIRYTPAINFAFDKESGRLANQSEIVAALQCTEFEKMPQFAEILAWVCRIIIDLRKIEKSISSVENPEYYENLAQLIKENKIKTLFDQIDGSHAEIALVASINFSQEPIYIGISKLCCAHCNLFIKHLAMVEHAYENVPFVYTRGGHGVCFEWRFPKKFVENKILRDAFLKSCGGSVYKIFEELPEKDQVEALQIVQSIKLLNAKQLKELGLLEYLSVNRTRENQIASFSASKPSKFSAVSSLFSAQGGFNQSSSLSTEAKSGGGEKQVFVAGQNHVDDREHDLVKQSVLSKQVEIDQRVNLLTAKCQKIQRVIQANGVSSLFAAGLNNEYERVRQELADILKESEAIKQAIDMLMGKMSSGMQ